MKEVIALKMWFLVGGALIAGVIIAFLVLTAIIRKGNSRRSGQTAAGAQHAKRRKVEFSKLILTLVLLTYFIGVFVGVKVTFIDISQLGVLLAFIGTPTAAAIGFYAWKAKAENIVKIKKDNPEETEGISVDLNNINV